VLNVIEYGGYKISRICFAFSRFQYRNYIFSFLFFLAIFAATPIKMLSLFFLCVFILLIFLPPVLLCSSIKLNLDVKFKKHAFVAREHREKDYTSDTNLVAVKAKFHAAVSLLGSSTVILCKGLSQTVGTSQDMKARAVSELMRSVTQPVKIIES